MKHAVKILGFAGSLRKGSYNKALMRAAVELVPADATIEVWRALSPGAFATIVLCGN